MAKPDSVGTRHPLKRISRRERCRVSQKCKEREGESFTASSASIPLLSPLQSPPLWRCLCGALCNGSAEFFDHSILCSPQDVEAPLCSASDSVDTSAHDMRGVMLQSLRAAVVSGRLEGDTLAAAVRAIQDSEEEALDASTQKQCGALFAEAEPWRLLPRTFLPVSGTALLAAAARRRERTSERAAGSYYTVVPDGLSYATRVAIPNTYCPRAAFIAGSDRGEQNDRACGGDDSAAVSNEAHASHDSSRGESFTGMVPETKDAQPMKLHFNSQHMGMVHYVYKRFIPKNVRIPLALVDRSANTVKDIPHSAKRHRTETMPQLEMDEILRQERHRISRVPMPNSECYYPN